MNPYIKIARIDHWFKNVFMLPGTLVAMYIDRIPLDGSLVFRVLIALLTLGLVASSNYVLNEILDADKDRHHPVKKNRPVPSGQINIRLGYALWLGLGVGGVLLASLLGPGVLYTSIALWIMGCCYNIPPVRTKEVPYLDVLSESVNNPLRLVNRLVRDRHRIDSTSFTGTGLLDDRRVFHGGQAIRRVSTHR